MEISMIETRALSPSLVVEVSGVSGLLDDALISRCLEALKWRGVLLIRGAHLDDEAQVAFSRKLGQVVKLAGQEVFTVSRALLAADPAPHHDRRRRGLHVTTHLRKGREHAALR